MRRLIIAGAAFLFLAVAAAVASGAVDQGIPQRLGRIEAGLQTIAAALTPVEPVPVQTTRLLFPFVTNTAGFDTGIAVANTGRDSNGVVGKAGRCTFHYFGRLATGAEPTNLSETTDREVQAGETITMTLSTGGGLGLQGNANFTGYIEVECDFPFAHGFSLITDGPIGAARVGTSAPALVLPPTRTTSYAESLGQ